MSDPPSRRARNIDNLIRYVRDSGDAGRTIQDAERFLVKRYKYGIRLRTSALIIRELVELGVFYRRGGKIHLKKSEQDPDRHYSE